MLYARRPEPPALRYLILLLLAALLAACTHAETDALRFGLSSAPVTLDPRFATDAASARIARLVYRQLVEFDRAQQPVPGLAEWQRLTPTHYRFHLRDGEGRRFHDGSRLTARDVKATYDSILDPQTASPHRSSLDMIAAVTAVDDDTIDFTLSRPDLLFPGRLVIGIMPAAALAADHATKRTALGSGPFAFIAWPQSGRLQLQRVSDGQRLEFLQVRDPTVRILKLQRGELDMVQNDLPPEMIRYAEARFQFRVPRLQHGRPGGRPACGARGHRLWHRPRGHHSLRAGRCGAARECLVTARALGGQSGSAVIAARPDACAGAIGRGRLQRRAAAARRIQDLERRLSSASCNHRPAAARRGRHRRHAQQL